MKKSSVEAMVLGTISAVLFALGMCMALIPEWDAFKPGIIFGCIGLLLGIITLIVWRKMEHKDPIHLSGRTILTIIVGVVGALGLGVGTVSYTHLDVYKRQPFLLIYHQKALFDSR